MAQKMHPKRDPQGTHEAAPSCARNFLIFVTDFPVHFEAFLKVRTKAGLVAEAKLQRRLSESFILTFPNIHQLNIVFWDPLFG